MKRLLNILVIDSIRELIRYKSFFLLVALLILLDRLLRHYSAKIQFQFDRGNLLDYQWLAIWTYETLPGEIIGMLLNWKLWAVAMGLFFFKQLTSMWPSSDMRLMHRKEGGTPGSSTPCAPSRVLKSSGMHWRSLPLASSA